MKGIKKQQRQWPKIVWSVWTHILKPTCHQVTTEGNVKVENHHPEHATIDGGQGIRPIAPIHPIGNRTK